MLVADAGPGAGLGHISRSSALAVALRCREVESRCYAYGAPETFERDGVVWSPFEGGALPAHPGGVLAVDSYRLPDDELAKAAESSRLVVMHDFGTVPLGAALIVSPAADEAGEGQRQLSGLQYVALRPGFWGLPKRMVRDRVDRILVTTGGGELESLGHDVARALARTSAGVTLVRGPYASSSSSPDGVEVLDSPDSLLDTLLSADVVITAGGQTMLEAAAAGTPCIALPVVDNQRRQVARLARLGAVRVVDPPDADEAAIAAAELANDADGPRELSRRSQQAIDGYGALRVAFHVAQLAAGAYRG